MANSLFPFALGLGLTAALLAAVIGTAVYWVRRWRHDRRRPNSLPKRLLKVREIEPLLAQGETLVWEGRPTGFVRPPRANVVLYLLLLVMVLGTPAALAALSLWPTTKRVWTFTWTQLTIKGTGMVPFGNAPVPGSTPAPGTSGFSSYPPMVSVASTVTLPQPALFVSFVLVVIAWEELRRFAGWRSRRYGITDRRVIALDPWEKTLDVVSRAAVSEVRVEGTTIVVEAGDKEVRFAGIVDVEAARSALTLERKP